MMASTTNTLSTSTTVTYNDSGTCNTDTDTNWVQPYIKTRQIRKLGKHTGSYGQKGCFGKKDALAKRKNNK